MLTLWRFHSTCSNEVLALDRLLTILWQLHLTSLVDYTEFIVLQRTTKSLISVL